MQRERPRVLLIAEAANPEWSSVPLVGWSHAEALAKVVDAHLVTQVRNRRAILGAGLEEGRDFTAIDSEAVARTAWRVGELMRGSKGKGKSWTIVQALSSLSYYYFEHLVWKQFGGRIKAGEFDVVHRLTPLSPASQSKLAGLCRRAGTPFVLGPLNGGLPWPKGWGQVRAAEREWLSRMRDAHRLLPAYRSTRRNSAAILVGSRAAWEDLPAKYRDKAVYIPENAIDPKRFPPPSPRRASTPIRLVFIGRLVPLKCVDVVLEAAAPFLRAGTMTFDILGDGPQRQELEELAEREGVAGGVTFHGMLDHHQVARVLERSDVLAFPSIHEFGGGVVLEAMAMGVVPMVVDYGGPGELASPQTGFLVELGDRPALVERYRGLLERIDREPSVIDGLRDAATRRARSLFTWDAKALQVLEVYRWVLGERPDKPDFAMPAPDLDEVAAAAS
jgi:glycosyltransferase involved in cell wall biosynthesis